MCDWNLLSKFYVQEWDTLTVMDDWKFLHNFFTWMLFWMARHERSLAKRIMMDEFKCVKSCYAVFVSICCIAK